MSDSPKVDDIQRTRNAVADTTFAWGALESALVTLLTSILQQRELHAIASAIYFAPSNFETRFQIIDRVLRERLLNHKLESHIIPAWDVIWNTMNRIKNTRNKVAHGALVAVWRGPVGRQRRVIRVTPAVQDVQRRREFDKTRQLPGLSPSDIEGHVRAVRALTANIERLRDLMWNIDQAPHSQLLQAIAALKEHQKG